MHDFFFGWEGGGVFFYYYFFNLSGIPSVSSSSDPDQGRHVVGPNLFLNCFQELQLMIKVATYYAGRGGKEFRKYLY